MNSPLPHLPADSHEFSTKSLLRILASPQWGILIIVLSILFGRAFKGMYDNWNLPDSYYMHGYLIPPVSLFFVWQKRQILLAEPCRPNGWGYILIVFACVLLILGDFLGLRIAGQLAIIPMLAGLILIFLGSRHLIALWFPLVFLIMMIPIPPSLTQSIALRIKLIAADSAVALGRLVTLPLVRDGSFVHFRNDQLLIGEVCGGLRSLIALLAVGAIVSYLSQAQNWARVVLFLTSAPIALIANIVRILFLCVVAYFWGSQRVVGVVHDASGLLIFLIAFILLFSVDSLLKRLWPKKTALSEKGDVSS